MGDTDTIEQHSGPLSWRDLYHELHETEKRIIGAFERGLDGLGEKSEDHEKRIRAIEQGDLPWVNRVIEASESTHEKFGTRIGDVEGKVRSFTDRETGIFGTINFGRQAVLLVLTVIGTIVAVLTLVPR